MRVVFSCLLLCVCVVMYLRFNFARRLNLYHVTAVKRIPMRGTPAKPLSASQEPRTGLPAFESEDVSRSRVVHVVFSTDCTPYQDWETEVVFNSADLVGHLGPVTRIASGCSASAEARLRERYLKLYGRDSRFGLHVTPAFNRDAATGKSYVFYNKPRGMEHFLSKNSGVDFESSPIIALIDPDFIFLRPLTDRVNDGNALVINPWFLKQLPERVEKGKPAGQQYGLGTHWLTFDRAKICGEHSPCANTTRKDAAKYYPVGPPYMMHHEDFALLAPVWRDFVPKVYEQFPHLLAEMYAYCMAAAHLEMKHARVNHMMLSNVNVQEEGWRHLDAQPLSLYCPAQGGQTPQLITETQAYARDSKPSHRKLPSFIHFCQNYRLGEYMFGKRRVPPAVFSDCGHPYLEEASRDIGQVDYYLHPLGNPRRENPLGIPTLGVRKRTASIVCLATWHVNAAAKRARDVFCQNAPPPPDPVNLFTFPPGR